MIEIDQILEQDASQWRREVDSGARPVGAGRPHRARAMLVAATVVALAVAITGVVLALVSSGKSAPSGSPAAPETALRGFTWRDTAFPAATIIFGERTANISDGCFFGLRSLRVTGPTLTIGKRIGAQAVCLGLVGGPPVAQNRFDEFTHGRFRWSVAGHTLTLTRPDGASLALTRDEAPAPSVTGQRWVVKRVQGTDGEIPGSYGSATFVISGGRLHANDTCDDIAADVQAAPTMLRFSHVRSTRNPCLPAGRARAVIDAVLSGTADFSIHNGRLMISRRQSDELLEYAPAKR